MRVQEVPLVTVQRVPPGIRNPLDSESSNTSQDGRDQERCD